ncbi:hypothetical protein PCC7424_1932 [Gloeothece citriformis PCC 7424]|uniref:Uncharacterized protein n=1 Tax=Gloeothece citriformis (strain PCC 7424) TaxID=65393 RepID=B7KDR1_GLOC7|nr:DUF6335 family protein [Gloeothece citriformis]ACK70363.1 hypothetical protein PCC7424_1932 [Gloeothece citriformis PCC 7424]
MDEQTIYNLSQDNLLKIEDDNLGDEALEQESDYIEEDGMTITANDLDANHYQAEVVGDEAIGGLAPTPEQNIVEDVATAVGVETDDNKPIRVRDNLNKRDDNRWELDPDSAEDH